MAAPRAGEGVGWPDRLLRQFHRDRRAGDRLVVVIAAFFILAIQLFITILEFKLTSLAGFVLVPFALWNRTSFLAERVLGNVVSSGIKVMVLAVIVGIGSNYFADFTSAITGDEVSIEQAVSLMLASLAIFGLSIFGPRSHPASSPARRSSAPDR